MDKASLEMLEFPRVLEILANYTSFSVSSEQIKNLVPSTDPELVGIWLKQSAEARHLNSVRPNFSIGQVSDIRESVKIASKGQSLMAAELLKIKDVLASSRNVRSSLKLLSNEIPDIWNIIEGITELSGLEKQIDKCINISGEVVDSASDRLFQLRTGLRDARQRLMSKLESMLRSRNKQQFIQDAYITERNSRYVIPVKADFKKDIRGIVHDISNTGATLFIEPLETVELGNEYRQMVVQEKQEVERILAELSSEVGKSADRIISNMEILADMDVMMAKARYAEAVNAIEPEIYGNGVSASEKSENGGKVLRLTRARHPLLHENAVPLNIEIGKDFNILVITGPNAGGKTVALKTVGLLALMTQAGIPIPASDDSIIPVFNNVFADIGDQQSIEHTLSTFSWHITNIVNIMKKSDSGSLVLLDELGISTDPEEGSALARSILLYLASKKTYTVATTHYNDLKVFAHVTPGMSNASMDFNPETFMPTYKLTVGVPGKSNAFSIAERLGISDEIIKRAREMVNSSSDEVELLLTDLMKEKQHYESLIRDIEYRQKDIVVLQSNLRDDEARLKAKEEKLITEISERLSGSTVELQRLIHKTEAELRKTRKRESIQRAKETVSAVLAKIEENTEKLKEETGTGVDIPIEDISPGDTVRIKNRNIDGEVISVDYKNNRVEIQTGNSRITGRSQDIGEILNHGDKNEVKYPVLKKRRETLTSVSLELDLRGKRADEVSPLLDRFINDSFLAGLTQVRIIHGYATGTVRQVVREMLLNHELISSFQSGGKGEGGDGVTIAFLNK